MSFAMKSSSVSVLTGPVLRLGSSSGNRVEGRAWRCFVGVTASAGIDVRRSSDRILRRFSLSSASGILWPDARICLALAGLFPRLACVSSPWPWQ